jgi:hypothetical protein
MKWRQSKWKLHIQWETYSNLVRVNESIAMPRAEATSQTDLAFRENLRFSRFLFMRDDILMISFHA